MGTSIDKVVRRYRASSDNFVWETLEEGLGKIEAAYLVFEPARRAVGRMVILIQRLQGVLESPTLSVALKHMERFRVVFESGEELGKMLPSLRSISTELRGGLPMGSKLEMLRKVGKIGDVTYESLGKVRNSVSDCEEWVSLKSKLITDLCGAFEDIPSEEDALADLSNGAEDMALAIRTHLDGLK